MSTVLPAEPLLSAGDLRQALQSALPELIALRRHLHAHPELSGNEHQTAALVAGELRGLGWRVREGVGRTGVLAELGPERDAAGRPLYAVVCPVFAVPALRHGTASSLLLAGAPCFLANLLDLPAGVVPVTRVRRDEAGGRDPSSDPVLQEAARADEGSEGLPIGVQVIAVDGRESTLLDVMRRLAGGADSQSGSRA